MLRSIAAAAPALTALVLAATAQAAPVDRYAAPTGAGAAPCAQAAPCSLSGALGAAQNGDDVLLTAGTYTVSGATQVPYGADVHPAPGAGRPTVSMAAGGQLRAAGPSVVSGLEIVKNTTGSAVHLSDGGTGERLLVRGSSAGGLMGIEMYANTVLRDSVVAVNGPGAVAVQSSGNGSTYTTTLRNDTLIATGTGATAADLSPIGGGTETHHVVNTILSGTGNDLVATTTLSGGKVLVDTHSSNYTTVKATGPGTETVTAQDKQSADPLFVSAPADAAQGDYHQLSTSPTVNAGTSGDAYAATAGTKDLDGDARVLSGAIDIGADEYVVPPVVDPPKQEDPTPVDPTPGDPAPVDPAPAPVDPGSAPVDHDGAGAPVDPPKGAPALARVTSARVTLRKRTVSLRATCPRGPATCTGTLALRAGRTTLGTAKVRVAAGRTATVKVALSARAARTVARYGHRGRTVAAVVAAGTRTATAKVLLRGH